MFRTLQGVFRNGKIELVEHGDEIANETPVFVTILPVGLDLAAYDLDQAQAADLRARLAVFAADWDQPEMDVYNDYDTAKQQI
ncbi:hypothetical protein [Candidatus Chloroploca asiatica]|uniref:Uncharacterized protein n=1 Tax=Candidatus Chloroploca asiatica TaxID=1506545 RepID=A0A2H3KI08_9CHLR|nr:hypothetical protein [Candidatus Chloroploca asiatica]PDV97444.1 hypothetical protein A9Q02_18285 [Candidatus Chloroploca asiatica]